MKTLDSRLPSIAVLPIAIAIQDCYQKFNKLLVDGELQLPKLMKSLKFYKKNDNYSCLHRWLIMKFNILIFGRRKGKFTIPKFNRTLQYLLRVTLTCIPSHYLLVQGILSYLLDGSGKVPVFVILRRYKLLLIVSETRKSLLTIWRILLLLLLPDKVWL